MNRSRIERVIANMRRMNLTQILVTGTHSVFYLSGEFICPGERMLALYIDLEGRCVLFANRLFALHAQPGMELVEFDDTEDPIEMLKKVVKPGTLGIDKFWPSQFTIRLMQAMPGLIPVLGSQPVDDARMCKDQQEIELMRESSRLNDEATRRTIAQIRAGMTETQLQDKYIANTKAVGGDGPSFVPITCFGANCAEPHHNNDETVLRDGDSIILDVGLLHGRYCSDLTRTVFFGSVSEEQRKVYDLVRRANEAGRAAIRPGCEMSEFDRAARKVIEDGGYGKYFIHRTGHGIGLEVHEPPDNSATNRSIALPGMCFSVEPGIYIPGKFGVRIEDLVCVTESGGETLNALDHELIVL